MNCRPFVNIPKTFLGNLLEYFLGATNICLSLECVTSVTFSSMNHLTIIIGLFVFKVSYGEMIGCDNTEVLKTFVL